MRHFAGHDERESLVFIFVFVFMFARPPMNATNTRTLLFAGFIALLRTSAATIAANPRANGKR